MVQVIGGVAAVLSILFLVHTSLVGLVKHRDRWSIFQAVGVGFLLVTLLFSALR